MINSVGRVGEVSVYHIRSVNSAPPSSNYGMAVTPVTKVNPVHREMQNNALQVQMPTIRAGEDPVEMAVRSRITNAEMEEMDMTLNQITPELSPEDTLQNHKILMDNLPRTGSFQTVINDMTTSPGMAKTEEARFHSDVIEDMMKTIEDAQFIPQNMQVPNVIENVDSIEPPEELPTEQEQLSAKFSMQGELVKGELVDSIG